MMDLSLLETQPQWKRAMTEADDEGLEAPISGPVDMAAFKMPNVNNVSFLPCVHSAMYNYLNVSVTVLMTSEPRITQLLMNELPMWSAQFTRKQESVFLIGSLSRQCRGWWVPQPCSREARSGWHVRFQTWDITKMAAGHQCSYYNWAWVLSIGAETCSQTVWLDTMITFAGTFCSFFQCVQDASVTVLSVSIQPIQEQYEWDASSERFCRLPCEQICH